MSDQDTAPQHPVQPDPDAPTPPPVSPYATQVADRPPYDGSYGQQHAQPYPQPYDQSGAPVRPRLRDIVLGLRGVIAVAIASLIVGGLGGWALGASTTNNGNDRGGFGPGQFQRGNLPHRQFPGQGGPFTGQAPNNTQPNR
jgi:hypothetical protein